MTHELKLDQWHHGYLGAGLLISGIVYPNELLRIVGIVILLDDLLQHLIQWKWDDKYASPLRYLYNKLVEWWNTDDVA